jgi:hypothetical protein
MVSYVGRVDRRKKVFYGEDFIEELYILVENACKAKNNVLS